MQAGTGRPGGESGEKEAIRYTQRDPKRRPGSAVTPQGHRRATGKAGMPSA